MERDKTIYERLFNGPAEVYVEYCDYTIHETAGVDYYAQKHGESRSGLLTQAVTEYMASRP